MSTELSDVAGRFSQISGHPALDLMNTVDWRLDPSRRLERLHSMDDVLDWCLLAGLLDRAEHTAVRAAVDDHPRIAAREYGSVLAWRELSYDAVVARSDRAMREVVEAYRAVLERSHLLPADHPGAWTWADARVGLTSARDRIVRSTVDLATDPGVALLHQCEDDACGWVYLDTSPRHNRRWCSAAGCGNRNRARRFNQRRRARTDREQEQA